MIKTRHVGFFKFFLKMSNLSADIYDNVSRQEARTEGASF